MTYDDGESYVEGNLPDDEQVARRLHELREYLDALVGRNVAPYDALTPAEQQLATSVGGVIVRWIATHEPDDAEAAARSLHDVRRYWSRGALDAWDDLTEDERAIGIEVMRRIIEWLQREGTA